MFHNKIWRSVRVAALAAATITVGAGSLAWAQDRNDYYYSYRGHDEAREHGYQNGYRDGLNKGQYDVQRGHRFKFNNDDWEDSRGFEHWMGSKGQYKQAYRDGYEQGYRRGFGNYGDRYRDRDDYRHHDRADWRYTSGLQMSSKTRVPHYSRALCAGSGAFSGCDQDGFVPARQAGARRCNSA